MRDNYYRSIVRLSDEEVNIESFFKNVGEVIRRYIQLEQCQKFSKSSSPFDIVFHCFFHYHNQLSNPMEKHCDFYEGSPCMVCLS